MQFAITDTAALAFARGFYQALAHNSPVDEAVRLGRIAIDGTGERTLEWVTPVLYLRTNDTRLFIVSGANRVAAPDEPNSERVAQEATLHALYVQALAALRTYHTDEAITLLDKPAGRDPGYQDAAELRDSARRMLRLAGGYERACNAENAGDWNTAVQVFTSVTQLDPGYRDAAARRDACHIGKRIINLQEELQYHAKVGDLSAVLATADELAALDPAAADPNGLASTARVQLDAHRKAEEQARREQIVHRQETDSRAAAQKAEAVSDEVPVQGEAARSTSPDVPSGTRMPRKPGLVAEVVRRFSRSLGLHEIPMDVYKRDNAWQIEMDLPGVDPDRVDVAVEHNALTVRARRSLSCDGADEVLVAERPQGEFMRQLVFGGGLDAENVQASYDVGVLHLAIPLAQQAQPRKVSISRGEGEQPTAD